MDAAASAGLENEVHFFGPSSEVPTLLEGADLAIHPSRGEGFSLAILEYMRAGLPVVLNDRPSVRQAIDDGRSGLVYPVGDVSAAAAAITGLVESDQRRQQMGRAGAETVRDVYPWSRTEREFAAVVEYLVGG